MPVKKNGNRIGSGCIVILVTCGDVKTAKKIARALVERELAACVNLLPAAIESVYRWKGKIESAKEFLLVVKTTRERFTAVQWEVRRLHSYEVPEIIALPVVNGSRRYLAWIANSVKVAKP